MHGDRAVPDRHLPTTARFLRQDTAIAVSSHCCASRLSALFVRCCGFAPPAGAARFARCLVEVGAVDLAGEVADAGIDGDEDAADRAPVGAALATLKAADEGRVDLQPLRDL